MVVGVTVLGSVFIVGVVSVIDEVIVVTGAIILNSPVGTLTPTVAVKHPSKHNIY